MKKIHLIGICGVGMSATALLLKEAGYEVTGSDAECYGPPAATLKNAGIAPLLGYRPENIPEDADEIIIGRNAKLAPGENAEADAARRSGKSASRRSALQRPSDFVPYERTIASV